MENSKQEPLLGIPISPSYSEVQDAEQYLANACFLLKMMAGGLTVVGCLGMLSSDPDYQTFGDNIYWVKKNVVDNVRKVICY